ncbi:MAG: cytochrome c family protein [Chromatiaceae bacterium]|jgi:hypothetical protein|nr:cytochrome c family protein [Chromatiaceae bacterium]
MPGFKSMLISLMLLPLLVNAADTVPADKAVIQFQTKTGVITFNHELHATLRTSQCESCHHTHEAGKPFQKCEDCHKAKDTPVAGLSVVAPKSSKAYHVKCKGCHEYTLKELDKPAGPTKCKLCHIKAE